MGYETENQDFLDPSDEQIDALAQGEKSDLTSHSIIAINELRSQIGKQITQAKIEGILNEKDAEQLEMELRQNSASRRAVERIGHKVGSVIEENRSLIDSFVKGLSSEHNISDKLDINDHVDRFKALPTEEKRRYVQNLRENLDFLESLYKVVAEHAPDKRGKFRKMGGHEKKAMAEELLKRTENMMTYQRLIHDNRKHFSRDSEEEYMTKFKELKTLEEQQRWIREFSKIVESKTELAKKFETFPPELQAKFPEFFESRKKGKLVTLQKLEREMEEAHLSILNGDPNSRHFSEKDRREAINWWRKSDQGMRILMLKNLPDQMKKTAELGKSYESLPDSLKLELQAKQGFNNFYELSFEEKAKALEEARNLGEHMEKLAASYEGLLRDAQTNKYMARVTCDAFMKEFRQLGSSERQDWINKFETHELAKRRELTERFREELPPETQQNNTRFYELGYSDRLKLFNNLLTGKPSDTLPEKTAEEEPRPEKILRLSMDAMSLEREGDAASSEDFKKEQWRKAISCYRDIIKLNATDEIAASNLARLTAKYRNLFPQDDIEKKEPGEKLDTEMKEALQTVKETGHMKERIKRQNIAEELAALAQRSEQFNAGIVDSRHREKHLETEDERDINDRLLSRTKGAKVVGTDGRAKEVTKVDVGTMGKMEAYHIYRLKREAVANRGRKSHNVHYLQLASRESGQNISAETGKNITAKRKIELQRALAQEAARKIEASGQKLSETQKKALERRARKDNLKIDLQQAA